MSRYAEAHAKPKGPGDARPTALQIIKDEGVEGKLKGEVIVITGTSSGIGIETTRALATTGRRCRYSRQDIQDSPPYLRLTADGHELQFGTNHLSHFLFYKLLEPALLAAASPDLPSRVVILASSAHNAHGINNLNNYNFQKGGYDPGLAYGQSKAANIYMANEIERRYGSRHLHSTSVHPGLIQTGLAQHMPQDAFKGMDFLYPTMKSVEQGAAISVWAAIGKEWEHKGGKYLANCAVAEPYTEGDDKFTTPGYAPHAYDVDKAKRLWSDSLKLVGLPGEE
ncbi:hypothetical protein BDW75DRAFT_235507 [Aspergillus navahoensis]